MVHRFIVILCFHVYTANVSAGSLPRETLSTGQKKKKRLFGCVECPVCAGIRLFKGLLSVQSAGFV
jgi:hypothetical protein